MRYTDDDLTFYLVAYQDFNRAVWCLDQLRKSYPVSRVVIDVDGDDNPDWAILAASHQAEVYYGDRLFLLEHGGALLKRMLRHHADDPMHRQWFFRIDTDTHIRRRFRYMSDAQYFGQWRPNHHFIQGGCIGLTQYACGKVLRSGILDNPALATDISIWRQNQVSVKLRADNYGLISLDWMTNWAMAQVGIRGEHFKEVVSRWKVPIPEHVDCAVAHPCKVGTVSRPI